MVLYIYSREIYLDVPIANRIKMRKKYPVSMIVFLPKYFGNSAAMIAVMTSTTPVKKVKK